MVLITGATGFVGQNLVPELIRRGYRISALLRPDSNIRHIKDFNIDIKVASPFNQIEIGSAVKNIEYIIHCAGALKGVKWEDYYKGNFLYTKNLVESVKKYNNGLKKFIFISSQAAAGPSGEVPKNENDKDNPISYYGKSKLLAEDVLKTSGLPYIILRPSSIYGPGDTEFLPLFKMALKRIHLLINKGRNKINLLYIKDFINAIILSMESNIVNKTYYVSDGKEYYWKDICHIVSNVVGKKPVFWGVPNLFAKLIGNINSVLGKIIGKPFLLNRDKIKEGLCRYWLFDITSIKNEIGFLPSVFPEEGFKEAYKFYIDKGWL
ncbi:MAG TPA: NAD-dependent epimerase/dehydratase family protein [Spirochaetota bacterium]|nr:NAD-dependent epimerase/dehydratase family protein [Spirochaetota bacterium]HOM38527.1 NAD-dependent epimerase/dehydratase family protein [Spirochaetota bacterium]HPQ49067.1 NAD-dependent epimerase/dehydratase family protein [Spirochaetota bacterium]